MQERTTSVPTAVQVVLDGAPLEMPACVALDLLGIRTHIEVAVLRRQRVLISLSVDGVPLSLVRATEARTDFRKVVATSADDGALGRSLLTSARRQTEELRRRSEEAVLWMLINPLELARSFWGALRADLREPLILLSFLPEATRTVTDGGQALRPGLADQAEQLQRISRRLDALFISGDVLSLSDAFEWDLVPWLEQLRTALQRCHDGFEPNL